MHDIGVQAEKMNGHEMDALLRRFERPLLQYATRILGDPDRARDVVQETFVKLQNENRQQIDNAPAFDFKLRSGSRKAGAVIAPASPTGGAVRSAERAFLTPVSDVAASAALLLVLLTAAGWAVRRRRHHFA